MTYAFCLFATHDPWPVNLHFRLSQGSCARSRVYTVNVCKIMYYDCRRRPRGESVMTVRKQFEFTDKKIPLPHPMTVRCFAMTVTNRPLASGRMTCANLQRSVTPHSTRTTCENNRTVSTGIRPESLIRWVLANETIE